MEAEDTVSSRLVHHFCATLGPFLAEPDEDAAPLALHWCLAPEAASMNGLSPDGHVAKGGFLPPVPLARRMWAGGEVEMREPLRIGDEVVKRSVVAGLETKQGRSGPFCLIAIEHELSTGRGTAIRERQDIAYLDPAKPASGADRKSRDQPEAQLTWTIEATEVLLFRYSALTFNGHRIHHDRDYATKVEGYRGLIVQGPLQASLLYNLAAVTYGHLPRSFSYRAIEPLCAGSRFLACSRGNGDGVECWTQDLEGSVKMKSLATWVEG